MTIEYSLIMQKQTEPLKMYAVYRLDYKGNYDKDFGASFVVHANKSEAIDMAQRESHFGLGNEVDAKELLNNDNFLALVNPVFYKEGYPHVIVGKIPSCKSCDTWGVEVHLGDTPNFIDVECSYCGEYPGKELILHMANYYIRKDGDSVNPEWVKAKKGIEGIKELEKLARRQNEKIKAKSTRIHQKDKGFEFTQHIAPPPPYCKNCKGWGCEVCIKEKDSKTTTVCAGCGKYPGDKLSLDVANYQIRKMGESVDPRWLQIKADLESKNAKP
ncbi:MAG: hypothetical protein GY928_35535 [Colwellia sp.]|nr:hypothetical protein [Colwellia sp.]